MAINRITITGAGNMAWHLCRAFTVADVKIECIADRTQEKAKALATEYSIPLFCDLNGELPEADAHFICVKDEAIAEVAKQIYKKGMRLVHTSGTTASHALNLENNSYGVMWPMQTLVRGNDVVYSDMLICITSADTALMNDLEQLASAISSYVQKVDDTQRTVLHLAAVWVNNFTNHMFDIADSILREHDLSFQLMVPMIRDYLARAGTAPPGSLQTGPAKRDDRATLQQHLHMLENHPAWKELYLLISESIRTKFARGNS